MKEFRLVAFGDSLTYSYGVLSHIAYPSRLARELPEITEGQTFDPVEASITEHFTTPPKPYTDVICYHRG